MISVAEWAGIYGAIVATGVFVWNIVKDRPRIKIELFGIQDNKSKDYDIFVKIINKSSYPFKIDFYSLDNKRGRVGIDSPIYQEIQIPSRDQHTLNFELNDIRLEFKNNEVTILDTFYVVDRTGRQYKKKIPSYIIKQAQVSSSSKEKSQK